MKYCRYVPIILTAILMICSIVFIAENDFNDLLAHTPDNMWLAAFVLMGFFVLKSLSVVFPNAALFITSAMIYPIYIAIVINLIGLALCFTVPYLVGRFAGSDLLEMLINKYPKAKKFVDYSHKNNLFTSYIARAVVVVPGDIGSLVFGALKMPYRPYLLGSILGVLPEMTVVTYIGGNLSSLKPSSLITLIILILATMTFTFLLNKKISRKGKQYDKEDF